MYKIVKLRKYDVLVPFICYQCGKCCKNFTPQIYPDKVPEIAKYLDKSEQEIKTVHEDAYLSRNNASQNIKDCPFLYEENKCSIYPLRPECCRIYPLFTDLGAADVDCRGDKEFKAMVNILFKHKVYAVMYDSRYYRKKIRPIIKIPEK